MRRIMVILAALLLAAGGAQAQRCLPGQRGVQAAYGMVDGKAGGDFYAALTLSSYTRNAGKWFAGASVLRKEYGYDTGDIPLVQYTASAGLQRNLWSDYSKTFFLNLGGEAVAGYETLNGGRNLLPDGARLPDAEGFVYGVGLHIEADGYVTDRIVLSLALRERMVWGSAAGNLRTVVALGITYMF